MKPPYGPPPDAVTPRLSVVVPTRDTAALILRCLASLQQPRVEVVVVDDASTDGTVEAITQQHSGIKILHSPRPLGFTIAANRGLAAARGDTLLLLNSDTEVAPGGLEALRVAFRADPRLGIAGAALHYPDGSPQWSGGSAPTLVWLFVLASGLASLLTWIPGYRRLRPLEPQRSTEVEWVTGAAMAVRREVWEQVGPLDESFRFYGQDLDFCLRARQVGWKVSLVPDFRVLHHHGATIGRHAGAHRGRQSPELLWTDLVRWASKHRGRRWAGRARSALRLGGSLRRLGRALASPCIPPARRATWRNDSEAFRRALEALRSSSLAT